MAGEDQALGPVIFSGAIGISETQQQAPTQKSPAHRAGLCCVTNELEENPGASTVQPNTGLSSTKQMKDPSKTLFSPLAT